MKCNYKSNCHISSKHRVWYIIIILLYNITGEDSGFTSYSDCYSLQGGHWSLQDPLLGAREGAAGSNTNMGWMVTGGWDDDIFTALDTTEMFNNSTNKWEKGPALLTPMYGHCQVSYKDTVIVIGNI